jgi:adenine-specific DNA-methyltransferase
MPELDFKGKEFVRNHHLTVPYRPLVPVAENGVGAPDLHGNLIIHGDNLEALKALLPVYAGKIDCIFIDPPYNTGNERWVYNDNVNSPTLRAWFSENQISLADRLRHDKWCCMMWPRLKLLRELLAETGSIWITLDDNEMHRAKLMLDEIFGDENAVSTIAWQKKYAVSNDAKGIGSMHDHILVYSKSSAFRRNLLDRSESADSMYKYDDGDPRGPWRTDNLLVRTYSESCVYGIVNPKTCTEHFPPAGSSWRATRATMDKWIEEDRLYFGADGTGAPQLKRFLSEVQQGIVPSSWWPYQQAGHNDEANKELAEIMGRNKAFDTPKPVRLIDRILAIACGPNAVVLDSFAGSGTTAHAVLNANSRDNGSRKFILIELLDEANKLTAERVRRVIRGYPFTGKQRETLYECKLTWSEIQRGEGLRQDALAAKAMHEANFDSIEIKAEDGWLRVIGVRDVKGHNDGLGGEFTFCELGAPVVLEQLLSGEGLPGRQPLADYLAYLDGIDLSSIVQHTVPDAVKEYYVGSVGELNMWLMYLPDRKYLTSTKAALTLEVAREIRDSNLGGTHRVYSPAKYVGAKALRSEGIEIEHVPLPLALFRGHTG